MPSARADRHSRAQEAARCERLWRTSVGDRGPVMNDGEEHRPGLEGHPETDGERYQPGSPGYRESRDRGEDRQLGSPGYHRGSDKPTPGRTPRASAPSDGSIPAGDEDNVGQAIAEAEAR